jgi:hypothetical protein
LGDGDILFVDYEKSTSFTRRLRPSTPFSETSDLIILPCCGLTLLCL